MRAPLPILSTSILALVTVVGATQAFAFEGRIHAALTRGTETNDLLYTVGPEQLRIAVTSTNRPHPINIVELKTGAATLVFPHNRTFVRLKPAGGKVPSPTDGAVSGANPAATPPLIPVTSSLPSAGLPAAPVLPPMPVMAENLELKSTGETTNILGFACIRYELKQRRELLEVWATDQLLPYQPYLRNQPSRLGPPHMEEQWPKLLSERKLFPLQASLRVESGPERFRFEVKSVTPEKIADPGGKLFIPPSDYHEIQPLSF